MGGLRWVLQTQMCVFVKNHVFCSFEEHNDVGECMEKHAFHGGSGCAVLLGYVWCRYFGTSEFFLYACVFHFMAAHSRHVDPVWMCVEDVCAAHLLRTSSRMRGMCLG